MCITPSVLDVIVLEYLHPSESPDALQVLQTPHKQDIEDWRWSEKRQVITRRGHVTEIRIDGVLHSTTQPAEVNADVDSDQQRWYFRGNIHRDNDKPAIVLSGRKFYGSAQKWYRHGEQHRDNDQPAVVWEDGEQGWYQNDLEHRENNKPSSISKTRLAWKIRGKFHRDGGPAYILKIRQVGSRTMENRIWYEHGRFIHSESGEDESPEWQLYWNPVIPKGV